MARGRRGCDHGFIDDAVGRREDRGGVRDARGFELHGYGVFGSDGQAGRARGVAARFAAADGGDLAGRGAVLLGAGAHEAGAGVPRPAQRRRRQSRERVTHAVIAKNILSFPQPSTGFS